MGFYDKVWTEKYRPNDMSEMILSDDIKNYFTKLDEIPNVLFYGKPGSGKTTLAKILANKLSPDSYLYINASESNGIDVIRNDIKTFVSTRSIDGRKKIVILDEADGLSSATAGTGSSAQGALRNMMEEYSDNVRFILTANYVNKLMKPLLSRCIHFEFKTTKKDVVKFLIRILKKENIPVTQEHVPILKRIVDNNFPDIRRCVSVLQKQCASGVLEDSGETEGNEFVESLKELIEEDYSGNLDSKCFMLREFYLNREDAFSADYHGLMRSLFDAWVADKKPASEILIITDHMFRHGNVMDVEVNFFALIIKLVKSSKG